MSYTAVNQMSFTSMAPSVQCKCLSDKGVESWQSILVIRGCA